MGRAIKRVPLDFGHELGTIWPGYQTEEEEEAYDPPEGEGYQVWETVSEGSPVSPVFASAEELVEYLHKEGAGSTFRPCSRTAARHFIKAGFSAGTCAFINGYMVDGINAYSASLPHYLAGFDLLSDDIIDLLDGAPQREAIEKLLLEFRDRTDKFAQTACAAALVLCEVHAVLDEVPAPVRKAWERAKELKKRLYDSEES